MTRPIYMDNHATTRVDPRVVDEMLPYFSEEYGNAASRNHAYGWVAEEAAEIGRERVATLLSGSPQDVVFTSGATEANNLALKGTAWSYRGRGNHIVTVATEHKSVLDAASYLEGDGFRITRLQPERDGAVTAEQVVAAVGDDTILVSVMMVNNEIGVIQPVAEIAAAVKQRQPKCLFHTDAVQGVGTLPLSVSEDVFDMVSLSAHKIYGPKGVGALWVRRRPRVRLIPLFHGGGHERGFRSGTLPVPSIVGFGRACEIVAAEIGAEAPRLAALRDRLLAGILPIGGVHVNGSRDRRVAGNLNVSFEGVEGEALLLAMRGVAVSSGAACTSASREPSYVLRAIGVEDALAQASIRYGLGRFNTAAEVDRVIEITVDAVTRLRGLA